MFIFNSKPREWVGYVSIDDVFYDYVLDRFCVSTSNIGEYGRDRPIFIGLDGGGYSVFVPEQFQDELLANMQYNQLNGKQGNIYAVSDGIRVADTSKIMIPIGGKIVLHDVVNPRNTGGVPLKTSRIEFDNEKFTIALSQLIDRKMKPLTGRTRAVFYESPFGPNGVVVARRGSLHSMVKKVKAASDEGTSYKVDVVSHDGKEKLVIRNGEPVVESTVL